MLSSMLRAVIVPNLKVLTSKMTLKKANNDSVPYAAIVIELKTLT